MTGDVITVAIVEDDHATREALGTLIGGTPGFRTVATFGSAEQARSGLGSSAPNLLLDISLAWNSRIGRCASVSGALSAVAGLMLTVFAEEQRISRRFCNGACGYLLKRTTPARLLEARREALKARRPYHFRHSWGSRAGRVRNARN